MLNRLLLMWINLAIEGLTGMWKFMDMKIFVWNKRYGDINSTGILATKYTDNISSKDLLLQVWLSAITRIYVITSSVICATSSPCLPSLPLIIIICELSSLASQLYTGPADTCAKSLKLHSYLGFNITLFIFN